MVLSELASLKAYRFAKNEFMSSKKKNTKRVKEALSRPLTGMHVFCQVLHQGNSPGVFSGDLGERFSIQQTTSFHAGSRLTR